MNSLTSSVSVATTEPAPLPVSHTRPARQLRLPVTGWVALLLLCFSAPTWCSPRTIERIKVRSPVMGRALEVTIVKPQPGPPGVSRWPVIYLLHGYASKARVWLDIAPLQRLADSLQVLFVCPDADRASWYLDSPVRGDSQFESYLTLTLRHAIDSLYPTRTDSLGQYLIGSSMGGHGALSLLARRPDLYAGAVSISGPLTLETAGERYGVDQVLGARGAGGERWHSYSFVGLAHRLAGLSRLVVLDCGTSDFACASNHRASVLLDSLGIAHTLRTREGEHTLGYVRDSFAAAVADCMAWLKR